MIEVFEYPIPIRESDIDVQNHVGNERFVAWMSRVAMAHSDALGWSHERYSEAGVAWFVRAHHVRYLKSTILGDSLIARTWVSSMERMKSNRQYEFVHADNGDVHVRAETEWAFFDIVKERPCRILPEVAGAFPVVDV